MKIGITIHLGVINESLWVNGIKQNAIYLLKALSLLEHDVYLVNASVEVQAPYEDKVVWDTNEIPIKDWTSAIEDTDVMIFLGATYSDFNINEFKDLGTNRKAIRYVCGNNYIMDAEDSIFGRKTIKIEKTHYNQNLDEVWLIPQHEVTNLEYLRVLHNLPADKMKVVPFIWDPMFIDIACSSFSAPGKDEKLGASVIPLYMPGKENRDKQLACFEPNVNIIKWSIIPTLITEDYINSGGVMDKLTVYGGHDLLKQTYYPSIIQHTTLFKTDPIKLNYLPRIAMVTALSKTDIVLAHQWENNLNYSYLDALYLNFPLIHNADFIQDAGYYYSGFDIADGKAQLELAMNKHDKHIDKYNAKSQAVLNRYTIYNEEMVGLYGKLLENLMEPDMHELSYSYNWKTNTYL